MEKVRVRFAPSPTGPLHIGGARSALFNYLLARKTGGVFLVRIEDTDLERSSLESEKNILDSLRWLGLNWDEGIEVGGPHGPYRQTERLDSYRRYAEQLVAEGKAYWCYCSEDELEAERQGLLAKGEMPRYMGKCRQLTPEDKTKWEGEGRKPVLRFRVPADETVVVDDLVRGEVAFETNGIGDFVIVKSDGIPTYNFAVVIDDLTMNITHVVRGEEHLSNTPRQILLYQALGLQAPRFAHVSLILGKDRSKMSKRHGSTSVVQYQEKGYLPEALINFLVLLGWSPEGEEEIFSLAELEERFSLDRVAKNPAVFDLDKLNWINGYYIRRCSTERVAELVLPYLIEAGFMTQPQTPQEQERLFHLVEAVKDSLDYGAQVVERTKIFFGEEVVFEEEQARAILQEEQVPRVMAAFLEKVRAAEALTVESTKALLKALTKELKLGGRQVYMPIRVALTGQIHGPELFHLIPFMGGENIEKRLGSSLGQVGIQL